MKSLISTAIAAILLFVSLVPALADDDPEEFREAIEELFEELDEELAELLEEVRDSDEDFNELVGEFDEEFEEFQELAEAFQELATSFTGVESLVSQGMPQKMWVADGILHIRGQPGLTTFLGTIDGTSLSWTNENLLNLNLNLATGDGNAFITDAMVDLTWGDLRGVFDARGTFEITAGAVLLRYVGLGDGDFEGMIIMGTATGTLESPLMHEGIILNLDDDVEEEEADEEFADLSEEVADLVEEFEDLLGDFDDFVAEVLENPEEFDEEFAELVEEFLEFAGEHDELSEELAEEFPQFTTPLSGTVEAIPGIPEILFIDGNLIISQPFTFIDTGTFDGTVFTGPEVGIVRIVVQGSTGESIFIGVTMFTGTVDGESATVVNRFVGIDVGPSSLGRFLMTEGTGGFANFHALGFFIEGEPGFFGLAFVP